jgi:hypothetical protein
MRTGGEVGMTKEEAVKNLEKLKLSLMDSLQKTFYLPETKEDMQSVFDFFSDVQDIILNQTTVVRCKDCVNKECFGRYGKIVCDLDGFLHEPDWFCADGEKKSD